MGELDADLPRQRQHRPLRGRVGDLRDRRAHDGDERGGVDHRAARLVLEQVRDPVLAAEEDAAQVDVLDPLEDLERRIEDRSVLGRVDPGVVEEDVDPAELAPAPAAYIPSTCSGSVTSATIASSPLRALGDVDADDLRALAA